jgi:hypothetical protein
MRRLKNSELFPTTTRTRTFTPALGKSTYDSNDAVSTCGRKRSKSRIFRVFGCKQAVVLWLLNPVELWCRALLYHFRLFPYSFVQRTWASTPAVRLTKGVRLPQQELLNLRWSGENSHQNVDRDGLSISQSRHESPAPESGTCCLVHRRQDSGIDFYLANITFVIDNAF